MNRTVLAAEETGELLEDLKASLLALEQRPGDASLVDRAARALHTMKGSGAMAGHQRIVEFTHELETAFERVRDGAAPAGRKLAAIGLEAGEHIRRLLVAESGESELEPEGGERILKLLRALTPNPPVTFRICLQPLPECFANGADPLLLLAELEELGELSLVAHLEGIPRLDQLEPERCYTRWDVLLTTDRGEDAVRDVFILIENSAELIVERLEEEAGTKLGEILVERGSLSEGRLEEVIRERGLIGHSLVAADLVTRGDVASALMEQEHVRKLHERKPEPARTGSVRVPAEKLDTLVNIVGELVTLQARITELARDEADPRLPAIAESMERLTKLLRDNTMDIRMLPGRIMTSS